MQMRDELRELYQTIGKHSQYQALPKIIQSNLGIEFIPSKSRFERERLRFILENCSPKEKKVLDIGGNIGFFTFEMIFHGAERVVYYEGEKIYSTFVEILTQFLRFEEKIIIRESYFPFDEPPPEFHNLTLLLNVLHHVGDDFGSKNLNRLQAKQKILKYINVLSSYTEYLVFQMGFCWKGNRDMPLFPHGTKEEMICYLREGTEKLWNIVSIGVPEKHGEEVVYCPLNEKNILRDDSLGEFLNRPLFILEAKR